jgi:hypothetical protein
VGIFENFWIKRILGFYYFFSNTQTLTYKMNIATNHYQLASLSIRNRFTVSDWQRGSWNQSHPARVGLRNTRRTNINNNILLSPKRCLEEGAEIITIKLTMITRDKTRIDTPRPYTLTAPVSVSISVQTHTDTRITDYVVYSAL